jgi:hypothetical protein
MIKTVYRGPYYTLKINRAVQNFIIVFTFDLASVYSLGVDAGSLELRSRRPPPFVYLRRPALFCCVTFIRTLGLRY